VSIDPPDPLDPLARVEKLLEERFPTRMIPDLDRITDLLALLGDPQRAYPSIHLTGTNGKTSTARMIDDLLRELGLRTGRYTSPHLESVTERIALDGQPLSPERFAEVYDEVAPYAELVDARHPDSVTFFEFVTAMAFAAFADSPVDAAVVEVGLGGTWDATNLVRAPVVVMTTIGLDHMAVLGDTVARRSWRPRSRRRRRPCWTRAPRPLARRSFGRASTSAYSPGSSPSAGRC
jgi:dihydrofolate synthase/folylpolyglutamate synthase